MQLLLPWQRHRHLETWQQASGLTGSAWTVEEGE